MHFRPRCKNHQIAHFCTFSPNDGLKANTGNGFSGCQFWAKTQKEMNIYFLYMSSKSLCWQGFDTY